MTKYQQCFEDMLKQNKEIFDKFKDIHDKFASDPNTYKDEFNEIGRDVQDIIRRYENRLCGHSESSGYSKFTTNLADKFQQKVREAFPKIDAIGTL